MHIFEGRGKGATWSLLLEALHNQGVVIVEFSVTSHYIRNNVINLMEDRNVISSIGADYLKSSVFSLKEWDDGGKLSRRYSPVYLDNALSIFNSLLSDRLGGNTIDIIALANDDEQVIDPFHIRERYNSFVVEQKSEDIKDGLHKRWRGADVRHN